MKHLILSIGVLLAAAQIGSAQASPAATESVTIGGKSVSIKYSAPSVRGREGKLFGKDGRIAQDRNYPIWRAGANSATALHTGATLMIGGVTVPPGDYTLYIDLSDPAQWQLVINKQTGQWGLSYDKGQDVGRVKMTMAKPAAMVETLKYKLADLGGGKGKLTLEWENHSASAEFTAK